MSRRLSDDSPSRSFGMRIPQALYVRIVDEAARRMATSHVPVSPAQVIRDLLEKHLPK